MVVDTADEFAVCIAEASILVVSSIILNNTFIILRYVIISIEAASTSRKRYLVAELDFSAGERRIEDAVIIDLGELTEFRLEVAVVALSPDTLKRDIRVLAAVRTMSKRSVCIVVLVILGEIRGSIETCIYMPIAVDLSARLEAEQELIVVRLLACILIAMAVVRVLSFAVPLYVVGIALEVADADAEVVELIGELSSEFVDQALSAAETSLLAIAFAII